MNVSLFDTVPQVNDFLYAASLSKILAFQISELKFSFQLLHLLEIPNGLLKNWQWVKEIFHN